MGTIILVGLLGLSIIVFLIFVKCNKTKEGLLYLKQYENQDQWRNVPTAWPIVQLPSMADYEIERDMRRNGIY